MSQSPDSPDAIPIPEPLRRRILIKNQALQRAHQELQELLDLTQELLHVPDGYVLYDVNQGFVPLTQAGSGPPINSPPPASQLATDGDPPTAPLSPSL